MSSTDKPLDDNSNPKTKVQPDCLFFAVIDVDQIIDKVPKDFLKECRNRKGMSLLHAACQRSSLVNCQYLVEEIKCDMNQKDIAACTPLDMALMRNDEEGEKIVKHAFLTNIGALLNCTTVFDNYFIRERVVEILRNLLGTDEKVGDYLIKNKWTLDQVARLHNTKLTKYVLIMDRELYQNYQGLTNAISDEDLVLAEKFLKRLQHSKKLTSWALLEAASTRSEKTPLIIELLLKYEAPIEGFSEDYENPLDVALKFCNFQNCYVLMTHKARISQLLMPIELRAALEKGDLEAEQCLRLIFEYQGLENLSYIDASSYRNIVWLTGLHNGDINLRRIAIEYYTRDPKYQGREEDLVRIQKHHELFQHYLDCKKYIQKMKDVRIGVAEGSVSLYELLLETPERLVVRTKSQNLIDRLRTLKLKENFSVHGRTLDWKLVLATRRNVADVADTIGTTIVVGEGKKKIYQ